MLRWSGNQEDGDDPNDHHNEEVHPHEAYVEQGTGTKRTDDRHCSAKYQPEHEEEEDTHRNESTCHCQYLYSRRQAFHRETYPHKDTDSNRKDEQNHQNACKAKVVIVC